MSQTVCSTIRWMARVGALLIAAALVAFTIGEPVGPLSAINFREWVGMVLLFGAIAAMVLAWKWEFPAALISLFALAAFAGVVHIQRLGVLIVAAIPNLFLTDWKLRSCGNTRPSRRKEGLNQLTNPIKAEFCA